MLEGRSVNRTGCCQAVAQRQVVSNRRRGAVVLQVGHATATGGADLAEQFFLPVVVAIVTLFLADVGQMPLTVFEQGRRRAFAGSLDLTSQFVNVGVGVLMVAQFVPIIELGGGQHHADVLERLQNPVGDLLVQTVTHHQFGDVSSLIGCAKPQHAGLVQFVASQLLVGLHARLVLAPMDRTSRRVAHHVDHLGDRDGPAGAGVAAENPMRHQLGMHQARIEQLQGGQAITSGADGVLDDLGGNHLRSSFLMVANRTRPMMRITATAPQTCRKPSV